MITHLDLQMFDYEFQEITAEYEYPKDDYNSLTSLPVKKNENSDYVEISNIRF